MAVAVVCYFVLSVGYSSSAKFEVLFSEVVDNAAEEAEAVAVVSTAQKAVRQNPPAQDTAQSALVDYDADEMVNRGDGITRLVGNVTFHHNGAIIQCDSAFMHPDDRMEFFDNVVIEKDSALVYGDKVNYNQNTNLADVIAPIVKMMRGEAIMYSYNLQFNTETSVGTFKNGGVLMQRNNEMEAERGSFDANENYVTFYDKVAMRNDDYVIKTDSLGFSIDDQRLDFLARTDIWSDGDNFLQSDSGHYFSATKSYLFTSNAYVMTKDNEIWADTMRYYTETKQSYMFSDVQILDTTNSTIAFSDWAFYDDSIKSAVLAKTPSLRVWSDVDTSYLRADTILLVTMPLDADSTLTDSLENFSADRAVNSLDNASMTREQDTTAQPYSAVEDSSYKTITVRDTSVIEKMVADTVLRDSVVDGSVIIDTLITTKLINDTTIRERVVRDTTFFAVDSLVSDSLAVDSLQIDSMKVDSIAIDSIIMDSLAVDSLAVDSLKLDSLAIDSLSIDSLAVDSLTMDTVATEPQPDRLLKAYNNVRSWSRDYQMKCDSVVGYSADSTTNLFGLPVIWAQNNQISSDQVTVYTKNEKLDWADFIGKPVLSQQVIEGDTLLFNQAIGKVFELYFRENEIDYAYMSGNVQNIYYMQEGPREITAMVAIDCSDLTMYFENREPVKMNWKGKGSGPIYPMNQIPMTQARFLEGFTWQEDIRPLSRWDICKRVARSSYRAEVEKLKKPNFKITEEMNVDKSRLLKSGKWSDRIDVPTVTPEYFIERNRQLFF